MRKLRTEEIARLTTEGAKRSGKHPIVCVIEDVRSIHNVGSMFRTAEAAAIDHLYLTGITGTPENRLIHKAALGAEDIVQWTHVPDIDTILQRLKFNGYTIAALEITDERVDVNSLGPSDFPIALIVGNEVTGVSRNALKHADIAIEIDQFGSKHSLNVSVAFGIAVYRLVDHYHSLIN